MRRDLRADLRYEARYIPRLAVTVFVWLTIRNFINEPDDDFWAIVLFLGEFAASLAFTWFLYSLFRLRPRMSLTWAYPDGKTINGGVLTIEWTPSRRIRMYSLVIEYDQSGWLTRATGNLIAKGHSDVKVSCVPHMANLFVDYTATGATKTENHYFHMPVVAGRSFYDSVRIGVDPFEAAAATEVHFEPSLECAHMFRWHEKLLRVRQNVDDVYLVYNAQEFG